MLKDALYGAGGAIATRAISSVAQPFIPGGFGSNPLAGPILEAAVAVFPVHMLARKFLGQAQADVMRIGGLISAGLRLADIYIPGAQSGFANIIRAPLSLAPSVALPSVQQQIAAGEALGSYGDVEELPASAFAGFGDVEEVPSGIFN